MNAVVSAMLHHGHGDDRRRPGRATTRRFHGSKPGRRVMLDLPVLEGLPVAVRPLEEGVLLHGPGRSVLRRARPRARRTPRAGRALGHRGALGQLEHPALPADVVAERLEQPVAGRALRAPACRPRASAAPACGVLHPARERRADPAAAELGVDGGVAAVVAAELGVRHQTVAVEDPDGRVRDVEATAGSSPRRCRPPRSPPRRCRASSWAAITSKTARASSSWRGRVVRPAGTSTRGSVPDEMADGAAHLSDGPVARVTCEVRRS